MIDFIVHDLIHQDRFQEVEELFRKEYSFSEATILTYKGLIEAQKENYPEALHLIEEAENLAIHAQSLQEEIESLCAKSDILAEIGASDKAMSACSTCVNRLDKLSDLSAERRLAAELQIFYTLGLVNYHFGNFDESLNYTLKCYNLAQQVDSKICQSKALSQISKIHCYQGDFDKALEFANPALSIAQNNGYDRFRGSLLRNIAQIYWRKGEIEIALQKIDQSYQILKKLQYRREFALTLFVKGTILSDCGEIDEAIQYHQDSLKHLEGIPDQETKGKITNNLGAFQTMKGNLNEAIFYFEEALQIYRELNHKIRMATPLNNLGFIYEQKGELERAYNYHLESLEISKSLGRKKAISESLHNLGRIHFQKDEIVLALNQLNRSLEIKHQLQNPIEISTTIFQIFYIHISKENLVDAELALKTLLELNNNDNQLIDLRCKLAQGMYLKAQNRLEASGKAIEIFEGILESKSIRFYLSGIAMINLCSLYLIEYKLFENKDTINKALNLVDRVYKIGQKQVSWPLIIHSLVLQSKILILKNDPNKASAILSQAHIMAVENKLSSLVLQTSNEQISLQAEIDRLQNLAKNFVLAQESTIGEIQDYLEALSKFFNNKDQMS